MPDLELCPFEIHSCMCQFCEDKCNHGLTCSDCNYEGKPVHDVYLCTGFKGDMNAYIKHSLSRSSGEVSESV